jgi:hypothetical protein
LTPNRGDTGAIAPYWKAQCGPPAESYIWKPIESAPLDEGVTLQVIDGRGKPYVLRKPSRLTAAGWVTSGKEHRWRSRRCDGGHTTAGRLAPDDIPPLMRSAMSWSSVRPLR